MKKLLTISCLLVSLCIMGCDLSQNGGPNCDSCCQCQVTGHCCCGGECKNFCDCANCTCTLPESPK